VRPSFVQSERQWMVPTVAIVAVALTLAVVGVLFARSDTGQRIIDDLRTEEQPAATRKPIPTPTPLSFDPPPGSEREHDDELPFLVDGDPATLWSTESYSRRDFGGLKPGVGIVLRLDGQYKLHELRVTSPSSGWSAEVLVAESVRTTRQAWGQPVSSKRSIDDGSTTFDLEGRTGGAVLLWITDLGQGNGSISIGELRLA
jgi:hypothetical protein